jgi:hypothetical protein
MSNVHLELPGSDRALLRQAVHAVEQQISALPGHSTLDAYRAASGDLAASWAALCKLLALGEAAPLRECPHCHHLGMSTATLCGYCWAKLPLLSAVASDAKPASAKTASALS